MVQLTWPGNGTHEPWLGVAATKETPAGRKSETFTPAASDGPALATVTVYVTF